MVLSVKSPWCLVDRSMMRWCLFTTGKLGGNGFHEQRIFADETEHINRFLLV